MDNFTAYLQKSPGAVKKALRYADVIFVNSMEWKLLKKALGAGAKDKGTRNENEKRFLQNKVLVVKKGPLGAFVRWFDRDGQARWVSAGAPRVETDEARSLGAGDCFAGAFMANLATHSQNPFFSKDGNRRWVLSNRDAIEDSMQVAITHASESVRKLGTEHLLGKAVEDSSVLPADLAEQITRRKATRKPQA
jgi:sugar/nucleoside kinase (ribokinase family)